MSKKKASFRDKIDSILAEGDVAPDNAEESIEPLRKRVDAILAGSGDARAAAGDPLARLLTPTTETKLDEIEISQISLPPGLKPSRQEDLGDLRGSISERGVLQPILLRPRGNGYEVVDGERRLAAAQALDMTSIPAVVRSLSDEEAGASAADRAERRAAEAAAVSAPSARAKAPAKAPATRASSARAKAPATRKAAATSTRAAAAGTARKAGAAAAKATAKGAASGGRAATAAGRSGASAGRVAASAGRVAAASAPAAVSAAPAAATAATGATGSKAAPPSRRTTTRGSSARKAASSTAATAATTAKEAPKRPEPRSTAFLEAPLPVKPAVEEPSEPVSTFGEPDEDRTLVLPAPTSGSVPPPPAPPERAWPQVAAASAYSSEAAASRPRGAFGQAGFLFVLLVLGFASFVLSESVVFHDGEDAVKGLVVGVLLLAAGALAMVWRRS